MRLSHICLFVFLTGCTQWLSCTTEVPTDRIIVKIPTIEQEATTIWRTIGDIGFLEGQGYDIVLPQDPIIDTLIKKSKNNTFGSEDFPVIYQLLESTIYKEADYERAVEKVLAERPLINSIIQQIEDSKEHWDWEFKLFDSYQVIFTQYGSGGSYDPDTGTITLFTTADGRFKKYDSPANTIIHEFVHLGMEASIVQQFNLSHGLKERVIDKFVYLHFGDLLPDYQVQKMGDISIDKYLEDKEDFAHLNAIMRAYSQ